MHRSLNFLFALALGCSAIAQSPDPTPAHGPRVGFDHEVHQFGSIPYAGDGRCEFVMTNMGDEPLIIQNFQSSCGCLVPSWDKEPVLPGKSTVLKARYDTQRVGPFQKSLTLTTNAVDRPVVVLSIKGIVLQPTTPER